MRYIELALVESSTKILHNRIVRSYFLNNFSFHQKSGSKISSHVFVFIFLQFGSIIKLIFNWDSYSWLGLFTNDDFITQISWISKFQCLKYLQTHIKAFDMVYKQPNPSSFQHKNWKTSFIMLISSVCKSNFYGVKLL